MTPKTEITEGYSSSDQILVVAEYSSSDESQDLTVESVNMNEPINQPTDNQNNQQNEDHQQQQQIKDKREKNQADLNGQNKEHLEANQPEIDFVYDLEWSKLDVLISSLNLYSSLLLGKSVDFDLKERIMKDHLDLYQLLTNLPARSASQISNGPISNEEKNQIVLQLDHGTRLKIIQCLIDNHVSTIVVQNRVTKDRKLNLINQNKELIGTLLNLPTKIVNETNCDLNSKGTNLSSNENSPVKKAKLEEQVLSIGKLVDEQKIEFAKHIDLLKKETQMFKEIGDLKKNLIKMQQKIDAVDANRSETKFIFEAYDIYEFLYSTTITRKLSPFFICQCVPWYISLDKSESINNTKYLSIYLLCFNSNDYSEWSIDTNFKLILLNQSDKENVEIFGASQFRERFRDGHGIGYSHFVEFDKLKNGGFIKENMIKVEVQLKINKFTRQMKKF